MLTLVILTDFWGNLTKQSERLWKRLTRLTRFYESLLKGNKEHLREINGSLVVYFGNDERSKLGGAADAAVLSRHWIRMTPVLFIPNLKRNRNPILLLRE